ncbi:MAG: hypothetical protein COB76_03725 [Alphaproteobacteria bacterium]|nr:MAG: hypothetical protein COB76_03725 [Alphaproteobacteria bacterium]
MSKFMFTYHGSQKPETQEEGQKNMEAWKAWAESLGAALVNPGTPVGVTTILTKDGASSDRASNPIMGFSILEAENMDVAVELLKDCPHFEFDGTLEISEMMEM